MVTPTGGGGRGDLGRMIRIFGDFVEEKIYQQPAMLTCHATSHELLFSLLFIILSLN